MKQRGFTIVELIVVIVVIALLAALAIFSFGSWRQRTAQTEVGNALVHASNALKNEMNFNGVYPTSFPSSLSAVNGVTLELITSADKKSYCINGYSTVVSSVQMSISSTKPNAAVNGVCFGVTSSIVGGTTIPDPPKNTPIPLDLSTWSLTGTASFNSGTGELTLGSNGAATSPLVRVSGGASYYFPGQFYANQSSPHSAITPDGAAHASMAYYLADGVTPRVNTSPSPGPYSGNGRYVRLPRSTSWQETYMAGWPLGNGIIYMRIYLWSSASNYSSPDLKIKNFSIVLT